MATQSPFPGMDPWLEQHWGDVHAALITYARDALNRQLPAGLRARMEERVYLEGPVERLRHAVPDVRVVDFGTRGERGAPAATTPAGVAVAEPVVVHIPADPVTETFVEIVDARSGNRVVTVIEVVSPANKLPGTGRNTYLRKQEEVLSSGSNLVEIDLLRAGPPVVAVREHFPPTREAPYQVCVRRASRADAFEVYGLPLRERLPAIRVPLRATDPDAVLDLQDLLDQAYVNGGYRETIDYSADPAPALATDDAAWAKGVTSASGGK